MANVAGLPGIVGASMAMPDTHSGYGCLSYAVKVTVPHIQDFLLVESPRLIWTIQRQLSRRVELVLSSSFHTCMRIFISSPNPYVPLAFTNLLTLALSEYPEE